MRSPSHAKGAATRSTTPNTPGRPPAAPCQEPPGQPIPQGMVGQCSPCPGPPMFQPATGLVSDPKGRLYRLGPCLSANNLGPQTFLRSNPLCTQNLHHVLGTSSGREKQHIQELPRSQQRPEATVGALGQVTQTGELWAVTACPDIQRRGSARAEKVAASPVLRGEVTAGVSIQLLGPGPPNADPSPARSSAPGERLPSAASAPHLHTSPEQTPHRYSVE